MTTIDITSFALDMTSALDPIFYILIVLLAVSTFGILVAGTTTTGTSDTLGVRVEPEEHDVRHDGTMPEAA